MKNEWFDRLKELAKGMDGRMCVAETDISLSLDENKEKCTLTHLEQTTNAICRMMPFLKDGIFVEWKKENRYHAYFFYFSLFGQRFLLEADLGKNQSSSYIWVNMHYTGATLAKKEEDIQYDQLSYENKEKLAAVVEGFEATIESLPSYRLRFITGKCYFQDQHLHNQLNSSEEKQSM